MVGILLVTHNGLGDSLADCVRHVMGKTPPNIKTLSVLASDDLHLKEIEARALVAQLDSGAGVLVLVDLFGATPCNIAKRLLVAGKVEGVSGVNLPMLLRVLCYAAKPLAEVAQLALDGGRECMVPLGLDPENYDAAAECRDH